MGGERGGGGKESRRGGSRRGGVGLEGEVAAVLLVHLAPELLGGAQLPDPLPRQGELVQVVLQHRHPLLQLAHHVPGRRHARAYLEIQGYRIYKLFPSSIKPISI